MNQSPSARAVLRLILSAALVLAATASLQGRVAGVAEPAIVISALHAVGRDGVNDEAFQITNVSGYPVAFDPAWSMLDSSGHRRAFPAGFNLGAGQSAWVARNAAAFSLQFGAQPALTFGQMAGGDLAFANHGGSLQLLQVISSTADTANGDGGIWPAGTGSPGYRSMERIDPMGPDAPANWTTTWITQAVALDGYGNPINGTPGVTNTWLAAHQVTPATGTGRTVVINEVAWGGTQAGSTHEWIELYNNTATAVSITGWQLRIDAASVVLTGSLPAHGFFLLQRNSATFSEGAQPQQTASFSLPNTGAVLRLVDERTRVVDALVYGDGTPVAGWVGKPLQPYTVTGSIVADGQVLARRLLSNGSPAPDSDGITGWLSDPADTIDGRRVSYPGWARGPLGEPVADSGTITLAITPDGGYETLVAALEAATEGIDIEVYTFDQPRIAQLLADKVRNGVRVRVLLEGAPAGGVTDAERWACMTVSTISASSGCWFMRSDPAANIVARYKSLHAKFILIDDDQLMVGSENLGVNAFPDDDKQDGTLGHRGVFAIVDAPALVARARQVFDSDFHWQLTDICRFGDADCPMGQAPLNYTPISQTGGVSYTVRYSGALILPTAVQVELNTSPENTLRRGGGFMGLIQAAGAGDELVLEQLDEPRFWGPATSSPTTDPNPRLEGLIAAARRGARVRILLDRFYDDVKDPRGNEQTASALNALALNEGLDLLAVTGNPTGHGIHNKMLLARIAGHKLVHFGSWNGSEVSAKINREMTVQFESGAAYDRLREMFETDLSRSRPKYFPIVYTNWSPPRYHLLISEVLYNPAGADELGREWVEIYNPGPDPVPLAGFKIGDAEAPGRSYNEGMYIFPANAVIQPKGVIVVAGDALKFFTDWGRKPDFELGAYDASVPDLIAYTVWSTGTLALGNGGDQVVLLSPSDTIIDAAQWLTDTLAGAAPYTGTLAADHTLQRWPPSQDTDDCVADFRDQAVPSPGTVP
ncbi:MAG: lamin tail domain-containing protein [Thermoflexales bacterium]|nr:lamin tail domain-containing protein [Thermoflexales bacterium]